MDGRVWLPSRMKFIPDGWRATGDTAVEIVPVNPLPTTVRVPWREAAGRVHAKTGKVIDFSQPHAAMPISMSKSLAGKVGAVYSVRADEDGMIEVRI